MKMRWAMMMLAAAVWLGAVARGGAQEAGSGAPAEAGGAPEKKVLFLTHSAGFLHPVLPKAEAVMAKLSADNADIEVISWEGHKQPKDAIDLTAMTPELLADLDAVMFMTTGELPLTDAQKQALLDFVSGGGAFIGVHCAADTFYKWQGYGEMLGGYFRTHSWNHLPLTLKIEDRTHPATSMLGEEWTLADEFYRFGMTAEEAMGPAVLSRERVHVLMSIDTEKSDIAKQRGVIPGRFDVMEKGRDYPLAWCHDYGKGRVFYTALGHRDDVWENPLFQAHLLGGMRWAMKTVE